MPTPPAPGDRERELGDLIDRAAREVAEAVEAFALHEALASIWRLVAAGNGYVERTAPWTLGKAERSGPHDCKLDLALYAVTDLIRSVALLLRPFLPATANQILYRIGVNGGADEVVRPWALLPNIHVTAGPPLFPKRR